MMKTATPTNHSRLTSFLRQALRYQFSAVTGGALASLRSNSSGWSAKLALAAAAGTLIFSGGNAKAQQVWTPVTNDWNTATNWNPNNIPDMAGETAVFDVSGIVNLTVNMLVTIDGITFNAAAPAYTITNIGGINIGGAGIINNSANTQTINVADFADMNFTGSSTAGANVVINNGAAFVIFDGMSTAGASVINNSDKTGLVVFQGTSSAGSSMIDNSGSGTDTDIDPGSATAFSLNSSAGTAVITNSGDYSLTTFTDDSTGSGATINNSGFFSSTIFNTRTSAGMATINNDGLFAAINFNDTANAGSAVVNNTDNGTVNTVTFSGSSSAANSTINSLNPFGIVTFSVSSTAGAAIINNAGAGPDPASSSALVFNDNSSAGTSQITNSGNNTLTAFLNSSTAGGATVINSGNTTATVFDVNATAGNATIRNTGMNSYVQFDGSSSAGAATISNEIDGSTITFNSNSSGGAGTLNNSASAFIDFHDDSSAGGLTVNNNDSGIFSLVTFSERSSGGAATINNANPLGIVTFVDSSTAGAATINNTGAGPDPASSAVVTFIDKTSAGTSRVNNIGANTQTIFADESSAGSATIINSGAASFINFSVNSTAANATITNSGAGSSTVIQGAASGGAAAFINANSTAFIDISQLTTAGTTAGSIAGNGAFYLGSKNLAVGLNNTSTVFSGVIQDGGIGGGVGGSLTKVGLGALTLTGSNTFTGDTRVNQGLLVIDGATVSQSTFVNPGASLSVGGRVAGSVFNQGATSVGGTVGGNISNQGMLTVSGLVGGSVLNQGTADVGGTIMGNLSNLGTLNLAGTIRGNVINQGMFFGSGLVGGNVLNRGLLVPANLPQALTVAGSYTQSSEGDLRINIASTTSYGRLKVGGTADLAGSVTAVGADGLKVKRGDTFTFLTADGGVNGKFDRLNTNFGVGNTIKKLVLVYDPNAVSLQVQTGSFLDFADTAGLTRNQRSVARALDKVTLDRRERRLIDFLSERELNDLPDDFDRIAPDELAAFFDIGLGLAHVQAANLQRRTDDIRSGSRGFSAAGLAVQGTGPSYSSRPAFRTGSAGPTGDESKDSKAFEPTEENRFGVFLSGIGEWIDVDDDGNARGYDISTGGFTVGIDYKVTPNFAVGLSAGYAGTGADLARGGRIFVNGGKLGLYATYFTGGFYADAAVSGGYNSYDTKRIGLGGAARGKTEGSEFDSMLGFGYDFKVGNWTIGPTATVQYTRVGIDDFRERGSLAPLQIEDQSAESFRTAVGFRTSYNIQLRNGMIIRPELRASWQHEFADQAFTLESRFASGAGSVFSVDGPGYGRDSLLLSAGVAVQLTERTVIYVSYDGELARTNYGSHSVSGGMRVAF